MVMVMISSCESSIYIAWHDDDDDDDTLHGMMMTKTKVEMALNHRSPLILLLQGHEVILGNLADLGHKPDVTIKQIGIQDSVWAFQTALISVHLRCLFWKNLISASQRVDDLTVTSMIDLICLKEYFGGNCVLSYWELTVSLQTNWNWSTFLVSVWSSETRPILVAVRVSQKQSFPSIVLFSVVPKHDQSSSLWSSFKWEKELCKYQILDATSFEEMNEVPKTNCAHSDEEDGAVMASAMQLMVRTGYWPEEGVWLLP